MKLPAYLGSAPSWSSRTQLLPSGALNPLRTAVSASTTEATASSLAANESYWGDKADSCPDARMASWRRSRAAILRLLSH